MDTLYQYGNNVVAHFDGSVNGNELVDIKTGTYNAIINTGSPVTGTDAIYGNYVDMSSHHYVINSHLSSAISSNKLSISAIIRTEINADWQCVLSAVGRHIEFAVHKGGLNIKGFESGEWYMTGNHTTTEMQVIRRR